MTPSMIVISTNHPFLRFPRKDGVRIIQLVFRTEKQPLDSLTVVNTTNRFIRKINKEYLRHDYATDVIAFPLGDVGRSEGEIYINLDAARTQAREYGITFTQECARLLIHGVLHLLGYNDATKKQKNKMHQREDYYLEHLKKQKR
jgi:probable rRNA maturation factor